VVTLFEGISNSQIKNGWDYQLILSSIRYSQYCTVPHVNLVDNTDFGVDATHCTDELSPLQAFPVNELNFPLVHPENVQRSSLIKFAIFRIKIRASFWQRALNKLARLFMRVKKNFI
jgi:hypothetical protein